MKYPHDHENDVIYFGKTNFRNAMRKFGVKTDDRRRHMYVIGKTGMGKTTLLENMILSDIYAGHGCCYIDPHGDTAERLLNFIPSWRINDVVYFNPADLNYPIGFNILESIDENMKHLVAAGMMGVFKKIWEGVWSARMEYILNNTILALMDTPGTTLLGINRMLSDEVYRNKIIANVQDPIVKQFWIQEFGNYQQKFASEAVAPIQNKVGQFLSASIIRNIVAQAKSSMNIREIMDDERIFIVNLSKGRIGEDASRLLGGLIITKIQMSAMERVDVPESERSDFYMYVDEFQNFAVESFASILSEARKYRLNLIMAHQYIAQLTEEVRDAVFGNVGTMITFRVGSPDALFMEDEFKPRFTPEDIINLPKFHIYLKLMIDGVTSQPFSALTLPPIAVETGSEMKVVEQSRERYAGDRKKIEEKVAEWSGFGENVDVEEEMAKVKKKKKEAKKARFTHEYTCTRCGTSFRIPVELDRSRPIYCEECHPIVMEERKSGKGKEKQKKEEREAKKNVVDTPPKVTEGEVVEKDVSNDSVSLDALKEDAKQEAEDAKQDEKAGDKEQEKEQGGEQKRQEERSANKQQEKEERSDKASTSQEAGGDDAGSSKEDANKSQGQSKKKISSKKEKKEKKEHTYPCDRCGDDFTVPFKLDPSRPTYCKTCYPVVKKEEREERKRAQEAEAREESSSKNAGEKSRQEDQKKPSDQTKTGQDDAPGKTEEDAQNQSTKEDDLQKEGDEGGEKPKKRKRKRRRRSRKSSKKKSQERASNAPSNDRLGDKQEREDDQAREHGQEEASANGTEPQKNDDEPSRATDQDQSSGDDDRGIPVLEDERILFD